MFLTDDLIFDYSSILLWFISSNRLMLVCGNSNRLSLVLEKLKPQMKYLNSIWYYLEGKLYLTLGLLQNAKIPKMVLKIK